jgi:hypothetical protein
MLMALNVILYSKQRSERISFNNIDEVIADEIEHTFLRKDNTFKSENLGTTPLRGILPFL